ncbi:hypothetical protein A2Z10_03175 [Candidatus Azambacteria bacterium RBG_16_47_10]|uniref:DUF4012 domain-containing protein n=1 Tax=Candidatus Azambacteria bacterium RBG_16_47_10 TaxID=1797292 RepID=A0A1F5AYM6_9BACT|nr:MAG: hypothetical protein A2Z10_03175 [Candidatus Azambacteria bacterium RBG_16_47_10]
MDDNYFYGAERDIPIDISHDPKEGTQFARFYLDRANQNSNIYFVEQQEEIAASRARAQHEEKKREPQASPLGMMWRLAWLFAGAGAIALALFIVPHVIPVGQQAHQADYTDAYAYVLAAQRSVFALDIGDALKGFHSARARITPKSDQTSGMASVIGAMRSFIAQNMTPASTLDAVLADVVDRSAASAAPLADLSFASFFRADKGEAAGDIIERAFSETKNAEAAIENAERALIIAEENGESTALRAELGPKLSLMKANLERYAADLTLASWALGVEYPRRFLIIAQDSATARATGGVIRSLGVVTAQKGAITDILFDEVYNIDGQLQTNVIPPEPIQKVATAWAIHDANWFFDFPLSARKIAYFYEKAGGKRIDGVIAINDRMLKNILSVTGPITGKDTARVNAESGTIAGDPAALSALTNVLRALDGEKAAEAMHVIIRGLQEKNAMVWVSDRDYGEAVRKKGWDGAIVEHNNADYLAVVASDIQGVGNEEIQGNILKETMIHENGEMTHTVVVEFPRAKNMPDEKLRYLRVYVPRGSELLEASQGSIQRIVPQIDYAQERFIADEDLAVSVRTLERDEEKGVDVYEESGMTVFALWMPFDEKGARAVFQYATPPHLSATTSLSSVFQKQSGLDMTLHFSVIAPEGKTVSSQNGFNGEFHDTLTRDTPFVMTIQ